MAIATESGGSFGKLLLRVRADAGLTQERLAERSGLSVRTIRNLERGLNGRPREVSVLLLARALGLSGRELELFLSAARDSGTTDAGSQVVPRQLPAAVWQFTGRAEELRSLTAMLKETVVITALGGMGGIGKTALAVYWAHRVAAEFPDGQLYVDLRGFSPDTAPLAPREAVRGFLDALGVPPSRVPVSVEAQCALYRSLLAGKRVLVVLDNARDAAQVRPLLPGSASCTALVTSRDRLTSLAAAEGARILDLDVLSPADARELLVRRLGAEQALSHSAAVDELVELCAGLPLALSIAAARASGSPERLVAVVSDLRRERGRLDALTAGDPVTDVRVVFSWSYRHLDAAAARMFRVLGLHPGPDLSLAAAASLAEYPIADARRAVEDLVRAHLLTESSPGRYALHDLVLAYAAELAGSLPDGEREAAVRRMMDHYLHGGIAAGKAMNPRRHQIALRAVAPGVAVEAPADAQQALAWFGRETPVLLAVARRAAALGLDMYAWQIPWAHLRYLHQSGRGQDLISIGLVALSAAERAGHQEAQADIHAALALAYSPMGAFADAHAHLTHALDLYTAIGNLAGQSNVHLKLALTLETRGMPRDALHHSLKSLELSRTGGDTLYEGDALCSVAWYYALCGEFEQALPICDESIGWYRARGYRHGEAAVLDTLGYCHYHLGRYDLALGYHEQALKMFREVGDRYDEASSLSRLGDVHAATGETDAARSAWLRALAIMNDIGHVDAEKLRDKIGSA
jgi:tetratricopeptide (TPR) repeat protein/transcriptional regulator with XRE-family HTH domain